MNLIYGLTTLLVCNLIKSDESNPYLEALSHKQWKSMHKYVEVRPGAFLFYWFYFADGTVNEAEKKPLIIWIQGGPGLAATGIANFAEIGPLTMDMKPRNHTWVKGHNLLLIDHPVGTGFSYAINKSLHVKTDKDAAKDLLRIIKTFFKKNKEFRKTPTYLFGQSYGGKLCPRLGYYLQVAISNKRLKMNFKGIGIGSGWVDPKHSTLVQPGFLYNMGVIDLPTYTKTMKLAIQTSRLIEKKEYVAASELQDTMFNIFYRESGMKINFNNINQVWPEQALQELTYKVNKYVKPTLPEVNQSLSWNYVSDAIFYNLNNSFLIPSTKFLESLLNHTQLKVAIYNGNLDVVTPLAGATNWVHALRWHGAHDFINANRIRIRGNRNGFYKTAKQLSYWSVFGSGHWVPEDNPEAMEQILEYMMGDAQNQDLINQKFYDTFRNVNVSQK